MGRERLQIGDGGEHLEQGFALGDEEANPLHERRPSGPCGCSRVIRFAVGLFGEVAKIRPDRSSTASPTAPTSTVKSGRRRTGTLRPPATSASNEYMPNVGTRSMTVSPGAKKTEA